MYLRTCDLDKKWNTSVDTLCIQVTSFCDGWLYGHMQGTSLKFGALRRMQAKWVNLAFIFILIFIKVDCIVGLEEKHKTIASIALRLTVDNVTNLFNG